MILGIGIDLVELARVRRVYEKFGQRFLDKIFTAHEREHLPPDYPQYLAGRFAAKEATVKALGTGFTNGIALRHIEICVQNTGRPDLRLYGKAFAIAKELGCRHFHLSITHERGYAAAVVIMEG